MRSEASLEHAAARCLFPTRVPSPRLLPGLHRASCVAQPLVARPASRECDGSLRSAPARRTTESTAAVSSSGCRHEPAREVASSPGGDAAGRHRAEAARCRRAEDLSPPSRVPPRFAPWRARSAIVAFDTDACAAQLGEEEEAQCGRKRKRRRGKRWVRSGENGSRGGEGEKGAAWREAAPLRHRGRRRGDETRTRMQQASHPGLSTRAGPAEAFANREVQFRNSTSRARVLARARLVGGLRSAIVAPSPLDRSRAFVTRVCPSIICSSRPAPGFSHSCVRRPDFDSLDICGSARSRAWWSAVGRCCGRWGATHRSS